MAAITSLLSARFPDVVPLPARADVVRDRASLAHSLRPLAHFVVPPRFVGAVEELVQRPVAGAPDKRAPLRVRELPRGVGLSCLTVAPLEPSNRLSPCRASALRRCS
jgi:hypothetical protein